MAQAEIDRGIEALIHYAGWTDKFSQVCGSYNMVNGPFHNFTAPAPMGVVAILEGEKFDFGKLLTHIAACLAGGNSTIVLLAAACPAIIAPLAEVLATSDLPPGVVNLLTGNEDELLEQFAGHMEIRALQLMNENLRSNKKIHEMAVDNLKRVSFGTRPSPLDQIELTVEMQTAWHPIGI
jgi:acyl-CoA reductase-like NAD-dependent aldehyde dehydrogenase